MKYEKSYSSLKFVKNGKIPVGSLIQTCNMIVHWLLSNRVVQITWYVDFWILLKIPSRLLLGVGVDPAPGQHKPQK